MLHKRFLEMGAVTIILTGINELLFVISLLLSDVRESRYRSRHETVNLCVVKHLIHFKITAFFPPFIRFFGLDKIRRIKFNQPISCEFRENRFRQRHFFLSGVNKMLSVLSSFPSHLDAVWYRI